jgi:glycosyltransferase involved in cell wall biosynthesis
MIHRSRIADLYYFLRSIINGQPFLIERDDIGEMRKVVREIFSSGDVDCIHADQFSMPQYGLPYVKNGAAGRPILLFDAHNAVWTIVNRMIENVPWFIKPAVKLEAWKLRRYEGMLLERCDHILTVTDIDRSDLLKAWTAYKNAGADRREGSPPAEITVIPIAVDTQVIQPVYTPSAAKKILTLGTLHYPPNADGIRWFVKEVFPLVRAEDPSVTLTIGGRNPPTDFQLFKEQSGGAIEVTGYIPELAPYMREAAMVIVPVRAGSGMRVRILESFAYGMPVITTSIGLEGIDATPGEDVLVADTPAEFAAAIQKLLGDPDLQARLSENARMLVVNKYDWMSALREINHIYASNHR